MKQYLLALAGCAVAACQVHAQHSLSAKWISYVGVENGSDTVYAIAADSHTNAYFGGVLGLGVLANVNGVGTLEALGTAGDDYGDGFVANVATNGALLWSTCLTYGNGSAIHGLACADDAVYAGGTFGNAYDYEWFFDTRTDAILTKLDAASGAVEWSCELGAGIDRFCTLSGYTAVAADASGNVYAVGYTTIANLQTFLQNSIHMGGMDAVVVKHSPNGTVQWVRYLGGAGTDKATAVAVGADSAVYVAGQMGSSGFLAKLDTNGTVVYSALLGGSGTDTVAAMLCDAATGTLILGGKTSSGNFCPGLAANSMNGSAGGFVMGLTDLGVSCQTNWFRFVGGSGSKDEVTALAWMANGQVIAGGLTASGGWLAPQGEAALGYNGMLDGFLLQLNKTTGSPLWSTYVGGTDDDAVYALGVAGESVFAGGSTFSQGFAYDGFWDVWEKGTLWGGPYYYGFIGKWTQGAGQPPDITVDLQDTTVHEGENAVFAILAQSTPSPAYHWMTNGIHVTGSSGQYTIFSAMPPDDGTMVCCVASNIFGCVTSHVARLSVIANGSLTVALTPQQAVAQGAKWSIDSGATWENSGATLALHPGHYAVAFASIAGWETPAPQSVNVPTGMPASCTGAYTPILAAASRTVSDTNVTLTVQVPQNGVTGWTLVETLPSGLTPTVYAPGVWDSVARTLTFTGASSASLAYTVSVSPSGIYAVSGQLTSAPCAISANVTGDTQIIHANLLRVISGTNVTIYVTQPSSSFNWSVSDYLPQGLTPVSGSITGPNGDWFEEEAEINWYRRGVGQTLSYEVTGAPGTYVITGQGIVTASGTEPIFGDSIVVIPDPNQPIVTPNILAFSVQGTVGTLTFTSVVNQAYMVMTNATLSVPNGWHNHLPVIGDGPTTTVPNLPATAPQLFFRVQLRENNPQ